MIHTSTKQEYIDLMLTGKTITHQKRIVTKEIKQSEEQLADIKEQISRQGNPLFFWRFGETLHSGNTVKALEAELQMLKDLRIELNTK